MFFPLCSSLLGRVPMGLFLFESLDKIKVTIAFPAVSPKVSADSGVNLGTLQRLEPRSRVTAVQLKKCRPSFALSEAARTPSPTQQ